MNNWLGFSLSPHHQRQHQHQHQQQQQQLPFTSDVPAECFDFMPPDSSSLPSCLHPQTPPFGLVPAFNRDTAAAHSQDWNSKDANIIGSYSCSNQETPKLENFLGHSFSDSNHQEPNKQQIQSHPIVSSTDYNYNSTTTTTMGLSMIKNWLRNNPLAATNTKATESAVAPAPAPTMPSGVQTLSLSMSTGSSGGGNLQQCGTDGAAAAPPTDTNQSSGGAIESLPRKSIDTFGQRTSIYRGVTRHRWTGRYEAHLWDNSCRREGQTRKGRQVYLGGYDKEEKAARTYDLAALKYWGTTTTTNFPISNYEKEMEEMKHMTRQEYVASLRRKSSGFSRGASIYRGVTRHHQHGRWQARIGRVAGNKDLYLGTFSTQEEAAEAYDIAAIKFRGLNAVTNFEISRYDVKSIMESTTLPIGGAAKRLKDAETAAENMALELHRVVDERNALNLHAMDQEAHLNGYAAHRHPHPYPQHAWPSAALQQGHGVANIYPYSTHQRLWCKQEQDPESGFNDHQLEGNTQNFLLHKLMSLDSCSNPGAGVYESSGTTTNGSGAGFGVPLQMMMNQEEGSNEDGRMFGSGDGYQQHQQARNLYYNQESSNNGMAAMAMARVYDDHQGSLCNNWIPTGVPTLASSKGNTMAVCHGASTNFTVWNDT